MAAAHERYRLSQDAILKRVLAEPSAFYLGDEEILAVLRANRAQVVATLVAQRDGASSDGEKRMAAARALSLLGVDTKPAAIAGFVADDPDALASLLRDVQGPLLAGVADSPELTHVILQAIESPVDWAARAAAQVAIRAQLPGTREAIERRIAASSEPPESLLAAAVRLDPGERTLARLIRRVELDRAGGAMYGGMTIGYLADLVPDLEDQGLRAQALAACESALLVANQKRGVSGGQLRMLQVLAEHQDLDKALASLAQIATKSGAEPVRRYALEHMAALDASRAEALAKKLGVELPDPPAAPDAEESASLAQGADLLVREGVLTRTEADSAIAAADGAGAPEQGVQTLTDRVLQVLGLAERVLAYDAETGTFPNRHDQLIVSYGRASGGRFAPESAMEIVTPEDEDLDPDKYEYTVEFVHGAKLYRFHPANEGDWYDVSAVTAAVERALRDAGIAERFCMLEGGGQYLTFVFAEPGAWGRVAEALGLSPPSGADKAIEDARDYEKRVIEDMSGR